ncbi:MAG: hypothetical protein ACRYGP_10550 [Janthinobacterium lividum]
MTPAEAPKAEVERPAAFDAVAYLTDLAVAGCRVVLSLPATCFRPGDETVTYFIRPGPGHCGVMAKWGAALVACPNHVERVVAALLERRGVAG